ncbi:hypothetical protein DSO57_1026380 [Entomophthora muscae]|uniref:Uncharacterized protein n=1 Tax=Entomophthora muscae TaxID=34485 RepID=A0ACC2U0U6_9FUNG|nr:hypothetical protein DSO57_1026380 [Entomophthora muscae]
MKLIDLQLFIGLAAGHMFMAEPPPRKFQYFRNGVGQNQDYTIQGPLEDYRTFPCQGKQPGPPTRTYTAGSQITATIGGDPVGEHGGGHCQFSLSYNEKEYVVLKTIIGSCITAAKSYQVKIPPKAPNGPATFVWTWVNRHGNREFYMNCADINIVGGVERGALRGKDILIATINVPGKKTYQFPEEDFDRNAKRYYSEQPIVTIRPPKKR